VSIVAGGERAKWPSWRTFAEAIPSILPIFLVTATGLLGPTANA
jgi:hypothetical protein